MFFFDQGDLKEPARAEEMSIPTGDHPPIRKRPYRLAAKEKEIMMEAVKGQLEGGVVVPSRSSWASAVFIVWRK